MPDDTFLQKFHDLADADAEVRCSAARGVKDALLDGKAASSEERSYTLRRLVRGVQSSRQCARQGFCLALAEVLQAFPQELPTVLKLVDQTAELQAGLRAGEQKERLLGRLLVYAAVLQAGGLRGKSKISDGKALTAELLREVGRGLLQIYSARPYMAAAAACILSDSCAELCQGGRFAIVPEVISPWALDKKIGEGKAEQADIHVYGIFFHLRVAYEDALRAGAEASALKSWPASVRKDAINGESVAQVARDIGKTLASIPLGEAPPPALGFFCRWWLRSAEGRTPKSLQAKIWPAIEEGLFPEQAAASTTAQAFRGLAELAVQLREACADDHGAEIVLPGLVKGLPRGFGLLLKALSWTRSPAHLAAVHAHQQLVGVVSGRKGGIKSQEQMQQKGGKRKKGQNAAARAAAGEASWPQLEDDTRLAMLAALQGHKDFAKMPGQFQRQWQHALLAPLSPPGIRSRCCGLLTELAQAVKAETALPRATVVQLEQLAVHGKAPDEVILAVVCTLFTAAYFAPNKGKATGCYSLRSFKASAGLPSMPDASDDLVVPVIVGSAEDDDRSVWRTKVWSTISSLVRRTLPEAAEKLVPAAAADGQLSGAEDAADISVRTLAFQGCLSDSSLLVLRLHDWWEHISEKAPTCGSASPRLANKKKKGADAGTALHCIAELEEDEAALRKRAVESCRGVRSMPEGAGGLSNRQKNAICGLPLSLALNLLDESAEDRDTVKETLSDLVELLEGVPGIAGTKQKVQKKLAESLASIPTVAAELFVQDAGAFVREAAKVAWRELGMFTSDETLTSLCASIRDEAAEEPGEDRDDEEDDEEEDDDDDDGPMDAAKAARIAAFQKATAEGKARAAAAAAKAKSGDDEEEDEEDLTTLDDDGMLAELLGGDDEDAGNLLESFASEGLEGTGAPVKAKKLTRRQQQLRRKQEDLSRKFREVELLEIFLARFGDRRSTSLQLIHELFEASLKASSNAAKSAAAAQEEIASEKVEDGKGKGNKKKSSKADSALRSLEAALAQRLCKLLSRIMRQLCRGSIVELVSRWHSAEEWASKARALCALGQTQKMAGSGPRTLEAGSMMLYFLCAAHRTVSVSQDVAQLPRGKGWTLAEELLASVLREWGGKKDCDSWCQAALKAFAVRAPEVLRRLTWMEHIRGARKAFAQRSQLTFVANELLRTSSSGDSSSGAVSGPAPAFVENFVDLCAELLETSTLPDESNEAGGAAATSISQRQKLRREALQSLKTAVRVRQKADGKGSHPLPASLAAKVSGAVASVRDALPSQQRRGEVYQLCLHILRIVRPQVSGSGERRESSASPGRANKKQKVHSGVSSSGDEAAKPKKEKRRRSTSRSPSLKPAGSPVLKATRPRSPSLKSKKASRQ